MNVEAARVPFGRLPDGTPVDQFRLANPGGVELRAITYGGIITAIRAPDRHGAPGDVVLGHDTLAGYAHNPDYLGAIVGRYAGRIGGGRLVLEGTTWRLPLNHGPNHLHGGERGFDKVPWHAEPFRDGRAAGVRLEYRSPDGEEGYPGTLEVQATYVLTPADEVIIDFAATTDRTTVVNLTQHTYFNLAGGGTVLDHDLMIDAGRYAPIDDHSVPTGELVPVEGTPFDFRLPAAVGARIDAPHRQLRLGHGYDHTFALDRPEAGLRPVARLRDAGSGRTVDVATTEPGLQVYSGNFLSGSAGPAGRIHGPRTGIALETQHFPDSPNHPNFPSTVLRPGEAYRSRTVFAFTAS